MITKKTLKKISKGDYDALMGAIGELVDIFHYDRFDDGYESCLSDMEVHAGRIAERLTKEAEKKNAPAEKDVEYYLLMQDEVKQIISDYLTEEIKNI